MGVVIIFPARASAVRDRNAEPSGSDGQVIILPVVRIERYNDEPTEIVAPDNGGRASRKRRRRASRS